jgi:hypothetical protein
MEHAVQCQAESRQVGQVQGLQAAGPGGAIHTRAYGALRSRDHGWAGDARLQAGELLLLGSRFWEFLGRRTTVLRYERADHTGCHDGWASNARFRAGELLILGLSDLHASRSHKVSTSDRTRFSKVRLDLGGPIYPGHMSRCALEVIGGQALVHSKLRTLSHVYSLYQSSKRLDFPF